MLLRINNSNYSNIDINTYSLCNFALKPTDDYIPLHYLVNIVNLKSNHHIINVAKRIIPCIFSISAVDSMINLHYMYAPFNYTVKNVNYNVNPGLIFDNNDNIIALTVVKNIENFYKKTEYTILLNDEVGKSMISRLISKMKSNILTGKVVIEYKTQEELNLFKKLPEKVKINTLKQKQEYAEKLKSYAFRNS